ncbi:MAG: LacI family DNA-binding transcriptional regulator [Rhodothermales bacterium]
MEKDRITINKIAELAFVSRSVVSRVLNDRPNVSEAARTRVLDIIRKYNYHPSSTARSLATNRTYEICILVPRWQNEVLASGYWSLIFLGISERCIERGYTGSLSAISVDKNNSLDINFISDHAYDGYVLMHKEVFEQVFPFIQSSKLPAVAIGHDAQYPQISSIDVDNHEGAYLATRHLIKLGHKKIAIITGDRNRQESIDRLAGYKRALTEADISESKPYIMHGSYTHSCGMESTQKLLALDAPPTAIFCASDVAAQGSLLALHEAGLSVPKDMAMVGFDDLPASGYTIPPLSTIHQPIYEKGAEAANIIIDQIEGKTKEVVHINLTASLVVRASCGG